MSKPIDFNEVIDSWFQMAKSEIESSGEYKMAYATWFDSEKQGLVMEALDLEPQQIVFRCIGNIDNGKCGFMIFGTDMSSEPGQGLEFDDFVLVYEWRAGRPEPLKDQLRIGIINYRKGDAPIVRPIDWANAYWQEHAINIVKHFVPFRVRVTRTAK